MKAETAMGVVDGRHRSGNGRDLPNRMGVRRVNEKGPLAGFVAPVCELYGLNRVKKKTALLRRLLPKEFGPIDDIVRASDDSDLSQRPTGEQ